MCAIVGTLSPVSVAILSWLCGCRLSFTSWSGILSRKKWLVGATELLLSWFCEEHTCLDNAGHCPGCWQSLCAVSHHRLEKKNTSPHLPQIQVWTRWCKEKHVFSPYFLLVLFHLHGHFNLIQCLHGVAVTQTSGILIAFGGALIIATGEASVKVSDHSGSIIGLTFALAAVGARSMKIVIMDVLLAPKALFVGQGVQRSQPGERIPKCIWICSVLKPKNRKLVGNVVEKQGNCLLEWALLCADTKSAQDYEEPSPTNSTSNCIPLSPMELYSMQAPWCFITAMVFALSTDPGFALW